jgi:hypothetical protein
MSELIQGIDVIFKLIPQLKSFTGARRREYFERLVAAMFEAFQEVHEFYNTLILEARRNLVHVNSGWLSRAVLTYKGHPMTMEELRRLGEIKDAFLTRRRQDEHLRDAVRQDAQGMLMGITWPEERRFLAPAAYYFLGTEGVQPRATDIDTDVAAVLEQGGNRHWDTPSARLYHEMQAEHDPERLLEITDRARNSLKQSYMNVRRHFRIVQQDIVTTT